MRVVLIVAGQCRGPRLSLVAATGWIAVGAFAAACSAPVVREAEPPLPPCTTGAAAPATLPPPAPKAPASRLFTRGDYAYRGPEVRFAPPAASRWQGKACPSDLTCRPHVGICLHEMCEVEGKPMCCEGRVPEFRWATPPDEAWIDQACRTDRECPFLDIPICVGFLCNRDGKPACCPYLKRMRQVPGQVPRSK